MSFISYVAQRLYSKYGDDLGKCTIIFPNRRAGLFLKKELSSMLEKPIWAPETTSLEDFLCSHSSIKKSDTLSLIFELFNLFKRHYPQSEGFDSFYFWGEMLLRDFEEVDHYLVNAEQLFSYVKDDKQLAEEFYFLSKEQEEIIKGFWSQFLPAATKTQEKFVETWRVLLPVYRDFKTLLDQKNIGYTSHIYRTLLDNKADLQIKEKTLIFAGFNALTLVEENLIKHFVETFDADVFWDVDSYYLEDSKQEAGHFLRKYREDRVFSKTFDDEIANVIKTSSVDIYATGVSLEIGQAKQAGEEIEALIKAGINPNSIVVVLPQDHMLFPVLNALPDTVDKVNVTMGYPLKDTPLYGLLEAIIELQEQSQLTSDDRLSFYHKQVSDILNHPYLYIGDKSELDKLAKDIRKKNQIRILATDLSKLNSSVAKSIFRPLNDEESLPKYLQKIIVELSTSVVERFGLEKEFLYHFHQLIDKLGAIVENSKVQLDTPSFKALFKRVARSIRIPFSGEPIEGLQIMGVLETRNLNFNHVFILNMNEDVFPGSQRTGSFIPFRIRKAFDLPTNENHEVIHAYLFYRLLPQTKSISLYYNMYADFGMSGEISRFVRQIELESGLDIIHRKLSDSVKAREIGRISIETTEDIISKLKIYTDAVPAKDQRRLSASALNTYLDCNLKFYFRYILRLFSGDQMSDDLDARLFGNVLHKSLEYLYLDTMETKGNRIIDENDYYRLFNSVDGAIDKAFKEEFGISRKQKFRFEGRNVVMADLLNRFIRRLLEKDKKYAPFRIISLEDEDKYERFLDIEVNNLNMRIKLGADIDRVDEKENVVRVIDYKTGKDESEIGAFENIFNPDVSTTYQSSRKAGFQTFFYAWLFASKYGEQQVITPGLINIKDFFKDDFTFQLKIRKKPIHDARIYLSDFEHNLANILRDIFNKDKSFSQTEDVKKCVFCDFKGICNR